VSVLQLLPAGLLLPLLVLLLLLVVLLAVPDVHCQCRQVWVQY
jgi:hypothetical protein